MSRPLESSDDVVAKSPWKFLVLPRRRRVDNPTIGAPNHGQRCHGMLRPVRLCPRPTNSSVPCRKRAVGILVDEDVEFRISVFCVLSSIDLSGYASTLLGPAFTATLTSQIPNCLSSVPFNTGASTAEPSPNYKDFPDICNLFVSCAPCSRK